jgi:hypothetical protein
MVLTGSFVLSPVIGLSATVVLRIITAGRDAGVEASGPHDFAVHDKCIRLLHCRVHRIPRQRFVTIAKRPS